MTVANDTTPPIISSVSAFNITSAAATITWATNEASDSQVEYGLTTAYGNSTVLNTSLVTAHAQSLSGLSTSTLYHYRVKSRDAAGNLAVSGDFTFDAAGNTSDQLASTSATTPVVLASGGLSSINTVFIIVFENNNWTAIEAANPTFINSLLPQGAFAARYYNPPGNHPSEPNYIWMEAGANLGLTSDNDASNSNSTSTTNHLVTFLKTAGITWKTYQEDMPTGVCPLRSSGNYAAKHNPFVFFRDLTGSNNSNDAFCIAHNRNFTELATDLAAGNVARYNFITPNLCNDMHDCSIATGDRWLKNNLPTILNSAAFKNNGAVFITWDEGEGGPVIDPNFSSGDGPIGMIVLSPLAKVNFTNTIHYDHSSLVRTLQTIFGVMPPAFPWLNNASTAADMSDLFTLSPGDTTPPTVSITAPTSGSTVSGTVTVSATSSDNVGVAGVQFKLDGNNLGAEDTSSSFSISWNTTSASNGSHTLTAVARDAAGNTATSAAVSVTVDNAPPVLSSVSASGLTASAATITWATNEASDSQVDFGLTTAYGSTTPLNSTLTTAHAVTLTGLQAATPF
ncbi:MAG: hypothetical protein E6K68_10725, partial [Nitrospirae bacterium]